MSEQLNNTDNSVKGSVNIHVKLRRIREMLRLNQTEMGKVLGITRPYLSQLESGSRAIKTELMDKCFDALVRLGPSAGIDVERALEELGTAVSIPEKEGYPAVRLLAFKSPSEMLTSLPALLTHFSDPDLLASLEFCGRAQSSAPDCLRNVVNAMKELVKEEIATRWKLDYKTTPRDK